MLLVYAWLHAFIATLILETPVVLWLTRDSVMPVRQRTAVAIFANLATHPAVWFIIPQLGLPGNGTLLCAETWAVAVEWAIYFTVLPGMTIGRALGVSALANGVSYAAGLLLYQYTNLLS